MDVECKEVAMQEVGKAEAAGFIRGEANAMATTKKKATTKSRGHNKK